MNPKRQKYIKNIILIVVGGFLLLCQQCTNPEQTRKPFDKLTHNESSLIIGLIDNNEDKTIRIFSKNIKDTVKIDNKGRFKFTLDMNEPSYLSLVSHQKSIKIYLEPGDTLKIGFNPSALPSSLLFKGKAAKSNNYLKSKNELMFDMVIPTEHLYAYPPEQFKMMIDSFYIVQKINLDMHLELMKNESAYFSNQEKASIWYERVTKMYEYLYINETKYNIPKSFYTFERNTSPNNDSLLNVYEYQTYLSSWLSYLADNQLKKTGKLNYSSAQLALKKMQLTVKNINSEEVKNYLLTRILSEQIDYYGYKNSDELFALYNFQCSDDLLKGELNNAYGKYTNLSKLTKAPPLVFYDKEDNAFSLNDFLGSYIYIDVWATWCLPCRKQAPYFQDLANANRDRNIVFISLSIDKDEKDWLEYLNIKKLNEHQYIIREIDGFLDTYQIKTVPHFLIINDLGQIIDANATRPSEKKHDWLYDIPMK